MLNEMARGVAQNLGVKGTTEEIAAAFKIVVEDILPSKPLPELPKSELGPGPEPELPPEPTDYGSIIPAVSLLVGSL